LEEALRSFQVFRTFSPDSVRAVFDILCVSYVIYRLLALIRGPRAWRILGGIVVFVILLLASAAMGIRTLHWLMDKATILGPVALVILLLPELRQALEGFGKLGFWPQQSPMTEHGIEAKALEEIVAAATEMATSRTGALLVVERGTPLDETIGNGVPIDAAISAPLLTSIFYGANPLHDGAVIIRGERVLSAACRLPLSENPRLDPYLHMRHRAAIGISENHDCLVIVVSEERGTIGFVSDGNLKPVSPQELREELNRELRGMEQRTKRTIRRLRPSREVKEEELESRVS
jgi:diadenylate cyclase